MGQWVPTLPSLGLFPHRRPQDGSGILWSSMATLPDASTLSVRVPICAGDATTVAQGELEHVLSAVNSRYQTVGNTNDNKALVLEHDRE